MIQSAIAENIKSIIERKGLKHKAVAERAGYTSGQFSALLNRRCSDYRSAGCDAR